jgi:hypothetical protein
MNIPDDLGLKAEIDEIFNRIDNIVATVNQYQPAEEPSDSSKQPESE